MSTTRPTMPTHLDLQKEISLGVQAARAADARAGELSVKDEILAVAEDFAEFVARRGRGITVATPARRKLREDIERVVLAFVQNAEMPAVLDDRAEARIAEIVSQAIATSDQALEIATRVALDVSAGHLREHLTGLAKALQGLPAELIATHVIASNADFKQPLSEEEVQEILRQAALT